MYKNTILPEINFKDINFDALLYLATKDNTLYFVASTLLDSYTELNSNQKTRLQDIVDKGSSEIQEIQRSIKSLTKLVPNALIFKTYMGENYKRIGNDIDALVDYNELYKIEDLLFDQGYKTVVNFPKHEQCIMVERSGEKKLHIQSKVHWCWKEYLDPELIWKDPRPVIHNQEEFLTNNVNADFLIHIAHMNFEHPYFKLSELLYLFSLVPEIDLDLVLEQAQKYNWKKTLLRSINLMNNIHVVLYGHRLIDNIAFKELYFKELSFPVMFPRTHMVLAVIEKRITYYLLGRVIKIIQVLLTGETAVYTDPPERKQYIKDGEQVIKESKIRYTVNHLRHRIFSIFDNFK